MQNRRITVQMELVSVQNRVISVHFKPIIVQRDLEQAGEKVVTKKLPKISRQPGIRGILLHDDRLRLKK